MQYGGKEINQVRNQIDRLINKKVTWQRNKAKEKQKITGCHKITNGEFSTWERRGEGENLNISFSFLFELNIII